MSNRLIDMTGFQKGKITVIERDLTQSSKPTRWLCRCSCGNTISFTTESLKKSKPENLACNKCRFTDYTGTTVGKLYVIGRSDKPHSGGGILYDCQCTICGTKRTAFDNYLKRGGDLCHVCDCKNDFHVVGETSICRIKLSNSVVDFMFDTEDLPFVSQYAWFLGGAVDSPQPTAVINGVKVSLPQLLFKHYGKYDDSLRVMFKNKDTMDCRKANLELVTYQQMIQYTRVYKNNKSGYKGVDFMPKLNKWRARIMIDGKEKHLGLFTNIDDAIKARKDAEERFGYYAYNG